MLVNGINKRIVVNISSSDDNNVISEVVGSFEGCKAVSRDLLNLIGISLDWLTELMVTERVEMTVLKSSSNIILEVSIVGRRKFLFVELEFGGV